MSQLRVRASRRLATYFLRLRNNLTGICVPTSIYAKALANGCYRLMKLVSLRCSSASRQDSSAVAKFIAQLPDELRDKYVRESASALRFHYEQATGCAYWLVVQRETISLFYVCRVNPAEARAIDASLQRTDTWSSETVRGAIERVIAPVAIF